MTSKPIPSSPATLADAQPVTAAENRKITKCGNLWRVDADERAIVFLNASHAEQFASAPALLAERDELRNMLQRMVDECGMTRIAPEGIVASAPCLLTLEHARAALAMGVQS